MIKIPCPVCCGDGFFSPGDRHVENRKEVCTRCRGAGEVDPETGQRPETSSGAGTGAGLYAARFGQDTASQAETVGLAWNTSSVHPASGRKIIALYNDGSGAVPLFLYDGGILDANGDECGPWPAKGFDLWAYLPHDWEFYCEGADEEPIMIKALSAPDTILAATAVSQPPTSRQGVGEIEALTSWRPNTDYTDVNTWPTQGHPLSSLFHDARLNFPHNMDSRARYERVAKYVGELLDAGRALPAQPGPSPVGEPQTLREVDGWDADIQVACDPNGKRWRLEGANFVMQPIGEISAYEAECLCKQIISQMKPERGVLVPSIRRASAPVGDGGAIEALRPFAREADRYDPADGDDGELLWDCARSPLRLRDLRRARAALGSIPAAGGAGWQGIQADEARIAAFVVDRFGANSLNNPMERADRLLEEAIKMQQAVYAVSGQEDTGWSRADNLVDHVYTKDAGDPQQEMGGVMTCALALGRRLGVRLDLAAQAELTRIEGLSKAHFDARHQAKVDAGVAAQHDRPAAPTQTALEGGES